MTAALCLATSNATDAVIAGRAAGFSAFSPMHAATAGALVAGMLALILVGWRRRGRAAEKRLRWGWAGFTVATQALTIVYWLLPENFDLGVSLPIHVCDLAAWIAPIALLTQIRILRTLLYFWGLGLSSQAFCTPTVQVGPGALEFWLFWLGHTQIVGSALYDILVLGYRPSRRDLAWALGISVAYAGAMFFVNIALGGNYGYVGETTPDARTLIDALGAWPWRVVWIVLIGCAWITALWAVWPLASRLAGGEATSAE